MDFKEYEYNREQKKGYQIFTKDALIDIIMRKNKQIAEQQTKLLDLHSVEGSALFNKIGFFAVSKFPDAGSIEHLKKLKHEADEAIAEPKNIVEYADCLLALFGAAHKAGFNYAQLIEAGEEKLKIVEKRKWERLKDGTYQHCH